MQGPPSPTKQEISVLGKQLYDRDYAEAVSDYMAQLPPPKR